MIGRLWLIIVLLMVATTCSTQDDDPCEQLAPTVASWITLNDTPLMDHPTAVRLVRWKEAYESFTEDFERIKDDVPQDLELRVDLARDAMEQLAAFLASDAPDRIVRKPALGHHIDELRTDLGALLTNWGAACE